VYDGTVVAQLELNAGHGKVFSCLGLRGIWVALFGINLNGLVGLFLCGVFVSLAGWRWLWLILCLAWSLCMISLLSDQDVQFKNSTYCREVRRQVSLCRM
jgi:MFS family permease